MMPDCRNCRGTGRDVTDPIDSCLACMGTGREQPPPTLRDALLVLGFWCSLVAFAWLVSLAMETR